MALSLWCFLPPTAQIFSQADTSLKRWILEFAARRKKAEVRNGIIRNDSLWDKLFFNKIQVRNFWSKSKVKELSFFLVTTGFPWSWCDLLVCSELGPIAAHWQIAEWKLNRKRKWSTVCHSINFCYISVFAYIFVLRSEAVFKAQHDARGCIWTGDGLSSAALGVFCSSSVTWALPMPHRWRVSPLSHPARGGGDEGIQQLLCPPGGDEIQEGGQEGEGVTDRRDVAPKLPANSLQITIGFRDGFQLGMLKTACFSRKTRIRM